MAASRSNGFSIVEGLIILGVVVLLVGVGYVGWKALMAPNGSDTEASVSNSKSAEIITTKADLEAAEKALDELDFEDDNAAQAETQATL